MKNGEASRQQAKPQIPQMGQVMALEDLLSMQAPLWTLWQIQSVFFN